MEGQGRYVPGLGGPLPDLPEQGAIAVFHHDRIVRGVGPLTDVRYRERLLEALKAPWRKNSVLDAGVASLPPDLVARFLAGAPLRSTLRLRHAVDWALHGGANLEHLWLALLPIHQRLHREEWEPLEHGLIVATRRWNAARELPCPLNAQPRFD